MKVGHVTIQANVLRGCIRSRQNRDAVVDFYHLRLDLSGHDNYVVCIVYPLLRFFVE